MKIAKKSIQAAQETAEPLVTPEEITITTGKYENAISLIKAAIESLAIDAADDDLAKESIANLSVVLMDLQ